MNAFVKMGCMAVLGMGFVGTAANAQTDGSVELNAKVLDMSGNGTEHWKVAWVTKADGTFIKTIWRQGPSIGSSHWNSHCRTWYQSKSGSTAFDGYSSATAQNYSASSKNPIKQTWDCRDAGNNLMPDGDYKFWVQYAEDSGQGPYTTVGLSWTKNTTPATTTYVNQGSNFSDMSVVWSPVLPPNATITMVNVQGNAIIIMGTGTVSTAYTVVGTTNLNEAAEAWASVGSGSISEAGSFSNSIPVNAGWSYGFYQLTLP